MPHTVIHTTPLELFSANDTSLHVDLLGKLDKRGTWQTDEPLSTDDSTPMDHAESCGSFAQPLFVSESCAVPYYAGMVDVEFFGQTIYAEQAEVRDVVDIGHD
ncbi:hypothetical protein HG531_002095 [Fusarium graminearum]|nr:hypothetical protein HG531_002095 [Fusarium graminearum]